ncbi:hypothetical protein Mgra_00007296 [Meloidogyne graminicola]|uniref:Galectin n=1 Tax=Meloidogyne graminicola TaxID=189291 RepID=A0A8S9ZJ74_9BILA|nr:hypothetical protein Mgra_00007296 [Meloidogyne graminicola]
MFAFPNLIIFLFYFLHNFKITKTEILVKINWREYSEYKNKLENKLDERFQVEFGRQNGIKTIIRKTGHYDVVSFGQNKELIIRRVTSSNSLEIKGENLEELLWLKIKINGESEQLELIPFYGTEKIIIVEATKPFSYEIKNYTNEEAIKLELPERLLHFVLKIKMPEINFVNINVEIQCKVGDGVIYLNKIKKSEINSVFYESLFYNISVCLNDQYLLIADFDGKKQYFELNCDEAINEGNIPNIYLINVIYGSINSECFLANWKPEKVSSDKLEQHQLKHSEIHSNKTHNKNKLELKQKKVVNNSEKHSHVFIPTQQGVMQHNKFTNPLLYENSYLNNLIINLKILGSNLFNLSEQMNTSATQYFGSGKN